LNATPAGLAVVEPPQCMLRIDALADAIHVEGVVPAVPGERTIAVRAQAVNVAASFGGIDVQAGVIVRVRQAEVDADQRRSSPHVGGGVWGSGLPGQRQHLISTDPAIFAGSLPFG
jgi:hypothetical protein